TRSRNQAYRKNSNFRFLAPQSRILPRKQARIFDLRPPSLTSDTSSAKANTPASTRLQISPPWRGEPKARTKTEYVPSSYDSWKMPGRSPIAESVMQKRLSLRRRSHRGKGRYCVG